MAVTHNKQQFILHMNIVSAAVQDAMRSGRKAGLSPDAAALAGLIGVVSEIRVTGLHEDVLLKEALKVTPHRYQQEFIHGVVQ